MARLKRLKRSKKNEDGLVNGSWSELHPDLLTLVFSRLSFVDQPAFHCVCKSWRWAALAAGKQHIKQLWLMEKAVSRGGRDGLRYCTYKLVNYSSHDKCSDTRGIPCLSNCYFLAAKHGWVLVGRPEEYGRVLKTFFYDPFSSTTIDLPTLNGPVSFFQLDKRRKLLRFDFSAPPTSPECKVVAIFIDMDYFKWAFTATCSRGEGAWTLVGHREFDCIWLPHIRMVFHQGSFYCVAGVKERHVVGRVLAFHPETNTVRSFSGHPGRAEAAKLSTTPMEKILCRRLETAAALDVVERLGGEELFRELQGRDHVETVSKWRKQEGLAMMSNQSLGKLPFPRIYRPFLWEEGGQLLVPWNRGHTRVEKRAWLSPRWVQPGQPDPQWVSPNSEVTQTN